MRKTVLVLPILEYHRIRKAVVADDRMASHRHTAQVIQNLIGDKHLYSNSPHFYAHTLYVNGICRINIDRDIESIPIIITRGSV